MIQRVLSVVLFLWSFSIIAADTVLKLYRPFGDVTEQVAPVIKNQLSGQCFEQSHLILREDAWRCQANGKIYDPCFVPLAGKKMELICPQSPWIGDSVQILVQAPLNNERHATLDMSRAYPWAIELVNGEQCQSIDSDETYENMPVRYHCSGNNVLVGYMQRCKTPWSMLEKTPVGVKTIELSKAWF